MRETVSIMTFAIFIALCLGFLPVYGQERRGAGTQQPGANAVRLLMRLVDLNNDGKISIEEGMEFFASADQDRDDFITQKEITEFMNKRRREMRGRDQAAGGPNVDQDAPDFALKTLDGKKTIKLSDFEGKKPVVLVFGSYT